MITQNLFLEITGECHPTRPQPTLTLSVGIRIHIFSLIDRVISESYKS